MHIFFLTAPIFSMGCPEPIEYQEQSVQPPDSKHMVYIADDAHRQNGFWIDAFEFPNRPNQIPQASVSFDSAVEQCSQAGKRLCTAQEWRRACQGSSHLRFGYANQFEQSRCHIETNLTSGHTSLMNAREYLMESGQKQHCQTDGVFDLIGNLEEWVLDDWQGRSGSLEGGAWYTFHAYADCSGNYSRQPDYRTPLNRPVFSAGFRCCWTPQTPTQEDIALDAQSRLSTPPNTVYDPNNERQLNEYLWMDTFEYPNQPNQPPLTSVSWTEANEHCTNAGKRLCSAEEWELGCGGTERWPFPYGKEYIPDMCAILQRTTSLSGQSWACQSPLGAQDMVGSVWEWTSSPIEATVLKQQPNSTLYEIRGGSWYTDERKGTCTPSAGYPLTDSNATHADLGFRCCRGETLNSATQPTLSNICPNNMRPTSSGCMDQYEYPNLPNQIPLADTTFTQATQACQELGKHLCTDAEWYEACSNHHNTRWPYGNIYQERACNDHGWVESETHGSAAHSGTFSKCHTSNELYDMSGNLWEWVDQNGVGHLRGGGWQLSAGLGQCRSVITPAANYHAGETGFRCCTTLTETKALLSYRN